MKLQMFQVVLYCDRVVPALKSSQGAKQRSAVLFTSPSALRTDWIIQSCCMLYCCNQQRQFWKYFVEWQCRHSRNNSLSLISEILTILKNYCYYPVSIYWHKALFSSWCELFCCWETSFCLYTKEYRNVCSCLARVHRLQVFYIEHFWMEYCGF